MILAAIDLAAQTPLIVTVNSTQDYQIDAQTTITSYQWEAFTDENLTSLAGSDEVTLTSLGTGRENEIEVTWKKTGTYYLSISVTNNDGCVNKMAYTFEVEGNSLPLLSDDTNQTTGTLAVTETDGSGNLLDNDSDPDGDILSIYSINDTFTGTVIGLYGSLNWNTDGTYTYTPNTELDSLTASDLLTEVFTYTATDNNDGIGTATLSITITGTSNNEAPIAKSDFVNTNEDVTDLSIEILDNDSDPNDDLLSISIIEQPISGGSISIVDGTTIVYNPPLNYNGSDYFIYQICDNGTPSLCASDTVFIEVAPVNDAPVAITDIVVTNGDVIDLAIDLLENDYDVDGDLLSASIVDDPTSGGTISLNDGIISYTPPTGFIGTDTIIYQICDDGIPSLCTLGTIIVNVIDHLEAIDDTLTLYAGTTSDIDAIGNDLFTDEVTLSIIDDPKHGTYIVNTDGTITYTANDDYIGNDTITYVIANATDSDTATVVITIEALINLTTTTLCIDEAAYFSWEINVTGIQLETIDLTINDANGDLVEFLDDVALSGIKIWPGIDESLDIVEIPQDMETLNLEVEYQIGSDINVITSLLTAPDCQVNSIVAVWDTFTVYGEEIVLNVLDNDYDPDEGDIDTSSLTLVTTDDFDGPYHGEVFINSDGTMTYIPEAGYAGMDSLIYRICDDEIEQACDTAIVRLQLLFNDELIANNDYTTIYVGEYTTIDVLSNDYTPDDELDLTSLVVISDPENGNALTNEDGTISYKPLPLFEGIDSFQYEICDSGIPQDCETAWVYINVRENQDVIANRDDTLTLVEEAVNILVLNNDYDFENELDSSSLSIIDSTIYGELTILDDHTITYLPDVQFAGLDSFIYQVCDSGYLASCDTAVVYINVIDNNIAITVIRDDITLFKNVSETIDVLENDFDVDGMIDTTSLVIIKENIYGDAIVNSDGTITYTPDTDYIGLDSLIYSVCDNGPIVSCDTAVVYFNVVDNLPPVAVNDTVNAYNSIPNIYIVSINDYDSEGTLDSLSVSIIDSTQTGDLSFDNESGEITYWPETCIFGVDSFTYVIYDIQGNVSNEALVYITILIDPTLDSDNDGVFDVVEDLNGNGNPCDDDTDDDGTPNYLDTDDDGDNILTADEDIDYDGYPENDDTDGDGIYNYLDTDDDDDCILTIDEDFNFNNNYFDDDLDGDLIPDFLDIDNDGDNILGCDENQDLDGNGILDNLENWNSTAIDDLITIGTDETIVIPILANDSTRMIDSTIYIIVEPIYGFVEISADDWTITYQPDIDFIGIDSFVYVVCDYYDNCDTATVYINVEDLIFPPELFTPNGDGENDYYVITGLERYTNSHFIIYNRWGNKVYEKNEYLNDWDGYSNVKTVVGSKKLPVGIYYYILEYGNDREKAGALFLER
jgi:gliding motility-associated-like protein